MKKVWLCAALLAFGTSYADVKIGTVDFNKSIEQSKQVAALKSEMESKFKARRSKIEAERSSIQASVQALHRNEATLAKSDIEKRQADIENRASKLQKMESDYQRDLLAFRSTEFDKIVKAFKQSVANVAKKDGLNVVINQSAIVYSQSAVEDITDSVAKTLK